MTRKFEAKKAEREEVPLLIGLMGPSGSGKTYSALRLAEGIRRVSGGSTFMIDTEARRGLHYAQDFDFQHIEFGAPFGPLDYLAAIEFAVEKGATTVIVDSMSHEHEGPGGVLEMHDAELKRLGGGARNNFPAWAKPKSERRRLINTVMQMKCNFIFCFRAKEKAKPGINDQGRKDLLDMGWMAIAGEEFVYEMTTCALLLPGANGVPTWRPERAGERAMAKLPHQFRDLLTGTRGPLSEDVGEAMARWSKGDEVAEYRFPKGEHAGKAVEDVPADYLAKIAAHPKTSAKLRGVLEAEVARRLAEEVGSADDADPMDPDPTHDPETGEVTK